MGAFTGAVTAGIGWAANTYEWGNMARISAQAVSGGIMESLQGGNFGNGFFAAGVTAAVMPNLRGIRNDAVRTAAGALVGGTISKATGGKFANGAISGAIQAAMMGRRNGNTKEKGFANSKGTVIGESGVPFSRNPPDELAAKLGDPKIASKIEEKWTWMVGSKREDGLIIFVSESDPNAPPLLRSFPPAVKNPETGRYDYFERAAMDVALTPPAGYQLYATFHGHPWNTGYSLIKRFPFLMYDPVGPSKADYNMSTAYPSAYHIVRWRTAGITVNAYYGPRVERELSK